MFVLFLHGFTYLRHSLMVDTKYTSIASSQWLMLKILGFFRLCLSITWIMCLCLSYSTFSPLQPQTIQIANQTVIKHDTAEIPVCLYFIYARGAPSKLGISADSNQVLFSNCLLRNNHPKGFRVSAVKLRLAAEAEEGMELTQQNKFC